MLVHEVRGPGGAARGLELAFATPRSWLRPGRKIAVRDAPTSFGRLSYALSARDASVEATLDVPSSPAPGDLKLRLRLPRGKHLVRVFVQGRQYHRFNAATGTIDLMGVTGSVSLDARYH